MADRGMLKRDQASCSYQSSFSKIRCEAFLSGCRGKKYNRRNSLRTAEWEHAKLPYTSVKAVGFIIGT